MLARDRMGVRPLFHTTVGGCLYFASEVKALLEVPGVSAALDPIALDQIFTFWFPLAPRTPFKNIYELPPAHVLIAEGGASRCGRTGGCTIPTPPTRTRSIAAARLRSPRSCASCCSTPRASGCAPTCRSAPI